MVDDNTDQSLSFGRLLFGAGLALQASEDFREMDETVEYAESAGVPVPDVLAPLASGMMLVGGIGVALWRFPRIATGAVVTFLAVVTPTMHDFWNAEPGDRSGERLAFFGNLAMLGAALAYLRKAYR
ncbi:DoxX domain protein [Natronomonas pharaonis DSM 2160]|uniref:DoxX domain protein n=1 Tax=Natronomonas pharaonis (strain ATCC 35678 / DSM 2160 / CIP 103997 / JCM 8858 / NBRC 14720 / NCIMB 2260 / Gabara) TaxID=348780 RepID=A0A1U7EUQ1_NATPD|nr:DoxX family protein [Natronomonas pharaonis]CAI48715.1 DoxX domain protein [Natronomonas pharaonis DSM 2160]